MIKALQVMIAINLLNDLWDMVKYTLEYRIELVCFQEVHVNRKKQIQPVC
jgi:hypothetical protein